MFRPCCTQEWGHKGMSGTSCVSAHVLSIKIVLAPELAPESRSASVSVKFCNWVNGAILIHRLISHVGLMLRT